MSGEKSDEMALWRKISGIAGHEGEMERAALRAGLEKLFVEVEKMMAEEMNEGSYEERQMKMGVGFLKWERPFTLKTKMKGAASATGGTEALTPRMSTCVGPHPEGAGKGTEGNGVEINGPGREGEVGRLKAELRTGARTFLWDPVRGVCLRLEISHSKLSYLSKLHSGMAAHEISDRIKARALKEKFWASMSQFAIRTYGRGESENLNESVWRECYLKRDRSWGSLEDFARGKNGMTLIDPDKLETKDDPYSRKLPGRDELRMRFWKEWKAHKSTPEYDREIWAQECGFANFARMRKACLLEFGVTPQMLEYEVIDEIAEYYNAKAALIDRKKLMMDERLPSYLKPSEPFADTYSMYEQMRPEWMAVMTAMFG